MVRTPILTWCRLFFSLFPLCKSDSLRTRGDRKGGGVKTHYFLTPICKTSANICKIIFSPNLQPICSHCHFSWSSSRHGRRWTRLIYWTVTISATCRSQDSSPIFLLSPPKNHQRVPYLSKTSCLWYHFFCVSTKYRPVSRLMAITYKSWETSWSYIPPTQKRH